jgi:hypothetical protein
VVHRLPSCLPIHTIARVGGSCFVYIRSRSATSVARVSGLENSATMFFMHAHVARIVWLLRSRCWAPPSMSGRRIGLMAVSKSLIELMAI